MPPISGLERRRFGLAAAGLLASPLAAPALRAQPAWPDRPVRLVCPFGAGGASDTLSRTMAQAFPEETGGQTMVVENRGGAGGTIAGAAVAQARPDGATLMMADLGANAIAQELIRGLPYDPPTAFTPICHLVDLPVVLLVNAEVAAGSIAELFELARRAAQPLTYAHPGIGYPSQLAQELINQRADIRMIPVSYRSGAEVMRSIVARETEVAIPTVSSSLPFIREGKAKPLVVLSRHRVKQLPDVPSLAEAMPRLFPDFEANVWAGIMGPAGMPAPMVAAANAVFNRIIRRPEVAARVESTQAGFMVGGSPEQFSGLIAAEIARWTPLIRAAGLRQE